MNKLASLTAITAICCTTLIAGMVDANAAKKETTNSLEAQKRMMDTNSDGMVSQEEYTEYQMKRYGTFHKNAKGQVDLKDMTDGNTLSMESEIH